MKTLRQLCATVIVLLAFALSAYAGDGQIPCPGIASPPPTAEGQIETTFAESMLLALETVILLS